MCSKRNLLFILHLTITALPTRTCSLTVTTFNMLAPVHRSMPSNARNGNQNKDTPKPRESEREEWWVPRAEKLASFISQNLLSSDIILLQEWWFDPTFESLFDSVNGHSYIRVAERRPGEGRQDGMAVLIKKTGRLEFVNSCSVITGPQRIGQVVTCREKIETSRNNKDSNGQNRGKLEDIGREVRIANVHLSFPKSDDDNINAQRQTRELELVAQAMISSSPLPDTNSEKRLEIIGGDFNSNSQTLPCQTLERNPYNFVNCASALSEQSFMNGTGCGRVQLGATHRTHLGENVSVDHLFVRTVDINSASTSGKIDMRHEDSNKSTTKISSGNEDGNGNKSMTGYQNKIDCLATRLGYLDAIGTRIEYCQPIELEIDLSLNDDFNRRELDGENEGTKMVISDHKPVTCRLEWPRSQQRIPFLYENDNATKYEW